MVAGVARRVGLIGILLSSSGCYLELTGGVYPLSKMSTQWATGAPVVRTETSYSVGVSVGATLDFYGIGLAATLSPINKDAVIGTIAAPTRAGAQMALDHIRVDVDLPIELGRPYWFPRATVVVDTLEQLEVFTNDLNGASGPAKGMSYFLGGTLSLFTRNVAGSVGVAWRDFTQPTSQRNGLYYPALAHSALGLQARAMITFSLGLELFRYYTPSVIKPGPAAEGYKEMERDSLLNRGECRFNPVCY